MSGHQYPPRLIEAVAVILELMISVHFKFGPYVAQECWFCVASSGMRLFPLRYGWVFKFIGQLVSSFIFEFNWYVSFAVGFCNLLTKTAGCPEAKLMKPGTNCCRLPSE